MSNQTLPAPVRNKANKIRPPAKKGTISIAQAKKAVKSVLAKKEK